MNDEFNRPIPFPQHDPNLLRVASESAEYR
jgi:hypothetical protein